MKTKVLIIKLGYSETLDSEIGKVPSIGDVLRTTPVLWALKEKYPDSHITWLVSEGAEPLLDKNQFIDRILIWDEFVPFQLMREKFDVVVNFEKIPGVAALADMIDAWTKYGFRFESLHGTFHGYERGLNFIDYIEEKKKSNKARDYWQKVLIEMLGAEWREQDYIIGYKPTTEEVYDVGLNFQVGSKWPTKGLPMEKWQELERMLVSRGYAVSWQQGLKDLYEYMDWINSCRLIISNDSLGVHVALALGKRVIVFFGPTDPMEVYLYGGKGKIICSGQECKYMPCYSPKCITGFDCMKSINLAETVESVKALLGK